MGRGRAHVWRRTKMFRPVQSVHARPLCRSATVSQTSRNLASQADKIQAWVLAMI